MAERTLGPDVEIEIQLEDDLSLIVSRADVAGPVAPAQCLGLELSVIVPAYNEAERLPNTLEHLVAHLRGRPVEIIVVDDGSTDGTTDVAREHLAGVDHARCLRLPANRGKGAAIRHGVLAARGGRIAFVDADSATDLAQLDELVGALDEADVALGSRSVDGSEVAHAPRSRAVMGRTFNALTRRVTGLPFRDTQCGFKAFRAPAGKVLFFLSTVDGFAFDVELLVLAHQLGLTTTEVPVRWVHVDGSKVRHLTDSVGMAVDTVRTGLLRRPPEPAWLHVPHLAETSHPGIQSLPVRALVRRAGDGLDILLHPGSSSRVVDHHLRGHGLHVPSAPAPGRHLVQQPNEPPWETVAASDVDEGWADDGRPVEPLGLKVRYLGRRALRRGKYAAGHDPLFLPLLLRATPMGTEKAITAQTDLVVEGFPRSGNTFAVFAVRHASGGTTSVASHVHHPSQVKLAVRRGLPTLLVIREPLPCLASYLIAGPHGRPRQVVKEYIAYHRELLPYLDDVVVADFTEVTSDFDEVISRLNDRFGTAFDGFPHTDESAMLVLDAVDAHHRRVYPTVDVEMGVPRPSGQRSSRNGYHRSQLCAPELSELMAEAEHLRRLYLDRR